MAINTSLNQGQPAGGGTITTGSMPRLMQDGVKNTFGRAYDKREKQFDKILDVFTSKKNFELGVQVEGFGLMGQKPQGEDLKFDTRRQGFSPKYVHTTYAKGFIATMEAIQDELYGEINASAESLAFSAEQTEEQTGANILNRGFDAGSQMIDGDGKPLFAADHPNGPSGGTYSNQLAIGAAMTEASIEDLSTQIRETKDARGLVIALKPRRLICAPKNQFNATRILGSVLQNDTANNATNALRDMTIFPDGHAINDYLTDPTAWFIKTNAPHGLKRYVRMTMTMGEDNEFNSGNGKFKCVGRWADGWDDPRGAFGTLGA